MFTVSTSYLTLTLQAKSPETEEHNHDPAPSPIMKFPDSGSWYNEELIKLLEQDSQQSTQNTKFEGFFKSYLSYPKTSMSSVSLQVQSCKSGSRLRHLKQIRRHRNFYNGKREHSRMAADKCLEHTSLESRRSRPHALPTLKNLNSYLRLFKIS